MVFVLVSARASDSKAMFLYDKHTHTHTHSWYRFRYRTLIISSSYLNGTNASIISDAISLRHRRLTKIHKASYS